MLALLSLVLAGPAVAADTITVHQIQAEYESVFHILENTYAGDTIAGGIVVRRRLPQGSILSEFVRDNPYFLNYLVEHSTGIEREFLGAPAAEFPHRRQEFYRRLRSDRQFNALLLPVLGRYLASQGKVLEGSAPLEPRRAVPLHEMQTLAARFFYPDTVQPTGEVVGHICVGINGIKDLERERDLILEALVFAAIFKDLEEPFYGVRQEFDNAMAFVNQLGLSSHPETKLTRAQGVVWARMARSEGLRALLLEEARKRSAYLPFQVAVE